MCVHTEKFILKNWLPQLLGLTSLNFVEQASRLEAQAGFLCRSLEAKLLLSQKNSVFFFADLQLLGCGSPTLCKVTRFTQSGLIPS